MSSSSASVQAQRNDGINCNMSTNLEIRQQQRCIPVTRRTRLIQRFKTWIFARSVSVKLLKFCPTLLQCMRRPVVPPTPPPSLVRYTNRPFGHQGDVRNVSQSFIYHPSDCSHICLLRCSRCRSSVHPSVWFRHTIAVFYDFRQRQAIYVKY